MPEKLFRAIIEGGDYVGKSKILEGIDTKIIAPRNNIITFDGIPTEFKQSILREMNKPNFDKNSVPLMERFGYFQEINKRFSEEMLLHPDHLIITKYILNTLATHNIFSLYNQEKNSHSEQTKNEIIPNVYSSKPGENPHLERFVDKIKSFYTPDLTIIIKSDREDILERMKKRPPEHKYENDIDILMQCQDELIRLAHQPKLQNLYGKVIEVTNSQGHLDDAIKEVNNAIRNHLK